MDIAGIITKAQSNMLDDDFREENVLTREEIMSLMAVAPAIRKMCGIMACNTKDNIGNRAFQGREEYAYGKIDAFGEINVGILELYNKVKSFDQNEKETGRKQKKK